MREIIDGRLSVIHEKMTRMSKLAIQSIDEAMDAFVNQDVKKAEEILEKDSEINNLEQEIENLCVTFAATQSPLASDLRHMITILKIVTDLERIGDYSCNIAQVVMELGKYELIKRLEDLPKMEIQTKEMLNKSIEAYFTQDTDLAYEIAQKDEIVDQLYRQVYHDLLHYMKIKSHEENQIIGLILIGRYLERIADHSTNICERVIYMKTGENVKF
jgi:phosphate transport system protein